MFYNFGAVLLNYDQTAKVTLFQEASCRGMKSSFLHNTKLDRILWFKKKQKEMENIFFVSKDF